MWMPHIWCWRACELSSYVSTMRLLYATFPALTSCVMITRVVEAVNKRKRKMNMSLNQQQAVPKHTKLTKLKPFYTYSTGKHHKESISNMVLVLFHLKTWGFNSIVVTDFFQKSYFNTGIQVTLHLFLPFVGQSGECNFLSFSWFSDTWNATYPHSSVYFTPLSLWQRWTKISMQMIVPPP